MTAPQTKKLLLICDLNVFVQAYLFSSEILLEGQPYSFGEILIHETVFDEISIWPKSQLKLKKFTAPVIDSMIRKCAELMESDPVLSPEEKVKYFRWITKTEDMLGDSEKSKSTSNPDKIYLSLAMKSKGNIATHEASLRSITKKTIGESKLFSVGKMIQDRTNNHLIADKQVLLDGLANLAEYDEKLMADDKKIVDGLISSM